MGSTDNAEMLDDVMAAKFSFEEFATNDKFIDQGYYDSEGGVVVKDYHMEWVNALEENQKVAITAFTGSGKCISKEERVPLANGEMKRAENVQIGDEVLSFNTESQSIEPAKVSNFVENGVKDVYRVTTRNGRSLKVTGNHPFYTNEGWKDIENGLSEGDFVAQPVNLPTVDEEDSKLSVSEGRLLGALTAEGGLTGNNISFSNGCKEFTEKFEECIEEWRVELSKKNKYDYRVVNKGDDWRRNQLVAFLDDLGLMGCSSKTKFVPRQLFNSSAEVKSAFVSWLWAGDGYVNSRDGWEVSVCLTNKNLVEQLQDILLSLGIKSRVAEKKTVEEYDNAWRLSVETVDSVARFAEVTDIPVERKRKELDKLVSKLEDKERNTNTEVVPVPKNILTNVIESYEPSQAELAREVGCSGGLLTMYKNGERVPSKDNLRTLYEETSDERLASFLDSDVRWDKIVDVEYVGEEETVDLTVPKNHSFVANGFVTHNTSIPGVLYPLWRIFRDPETNILIISATLSQATRILNEIKHHIEHADYLNELKPEDRQASWSKSKVEFTTGGEIKCKPVGNGAKAVKGAHVDLAICDEAAEFDDQEKFHRNVRTRVESQGGDICLISTPVHENDLMANVSDGEMPPTCKLCRREADKVEDGYECPEHGELEPRNIDGGVNISKMGYWSDTYSVYDETVDEDTEGSFPIGKGEDKKWVKPLFPENFDRNKIMKLREENMTMFQKEYLCEPLAVEGDLFDPNDIIELYDQDEGFEQVKRENCDYYMGVDFAISHQGDYSVYTVVEVPKSGKPIIRWMERIRGMGLDAQEDRIQELHEIYDFERIVLDETNFGSTAKRNLKEAGLPIRGQDFKMKARNNLIVGLKSKVESGDFRIARGSERSKRVTDTLYNELLGFGTSETQSGSITYESTAKHDDTVMSLAMVLSGIKKKKDVVATMAF